MLKKLYINGYKHFINFDIEFEDIVLICGLNGTGKTTILDLIEKLKNFILGSDYDNKPTYVNDLFATSDVPRWFSDKVAKANFGLSMLIKEKTYYYSVDVELDKTSGACRIIEEKLHCDTKELLRSCGRQKFEVKFCNDYNKSYDFPTDWRYSSIELASRYNEKIKDFHHAISELLYVVSINPFNKSSSIREGAYLNMEASNFPSWYAGMLSKSPIETIKAQEQYANFIHGFKGFTYDNNSNNTDQELRVRIEDKDISYKLSFNELSHGQKILCVLYMLIIATPNDSSVIIDELENFIAFSEIEPLFYIMQDMVEKRGIQIILTSHHPKTTNWFNKEAKILYTRGTPASVAVMSDINGYDSVEDALNNVKGS